MLQNTLKKIIFKIIFRINQFIIKNIAYHWHCSNQWQSYLCTANTTMTNEITAKKHLSLKVLSIALFKKKRLERRRKIIIKIKVSINLTEERI